MKNRIETIDSGLIIDWKHFHGTHPYRFILDKRTGIDIDGGLDLVCAHTCLDMDESISKIDPNCVDEEKAGRNNKDQKTTANRIIFEYFTES